MTVRLAPSANTHTQTQPATQIHRLAGDLLCFVVFVFSASTTAFSLSEPESEGTCAVRGYSCTYQSTY